MTKTRAVLAVTLGTVALGIVGQIIVAQVEVPELPNLFRINYKLNIKGGLTPNNGMPVTIYVCNASEYPPFCPAYTPPAGTGSCNGWSANGSVDVSTLDCPPSNQTFDVFSTTDDAERYNLLGWFTSGPVTGSCRRGYYSNVQSNQSLLSCTVPKPTPIQCDTANGYHQCPPKWVDYGNLHYWAGPICCAADRYCEVSFSWSTSCPIAKCCYDNEYGHWCDPQ